ncbi:UNVERIFIED_CONTAM: hypothetical protein Sradi_6864700 [Sesamum radiatum]|uniref:SWIM-type domain-containing protein n=1 Tax=Sesamum radiatum TaxID=300843 RepID=A0AAW2JJY1_SESRA
MGDIDEDDMDDADFVGNDYELDSVSGDDEYDDELYENFVDDVSAEMDSANETNSKSSGDVVVSDNDMDEHRLFEDDDNEHNFPVFNPVEMYNPSLELGMIFCSKQEFKKAVQSYAIKQKRSVKLTKNDSFRVYAVCAGDGCQWKIHANKLKNEETFQINLGLAYKTALWKATRASTVGEFKLRMEEMKQLNQDAFDWFNDKPPSEWNLEMRTCTCRLWKLSGIPCKHACSAIFNQNLQPEDMRHPYYNVETYKQVYEPAILSISGETLWTETGFIPPLPPNFGRGPGRPAGARNREPDEPNVKTAKKIGKKPVKLRRQKVKHHCKICGEEGHNAKACALWEDMQEPGIDEEVMDSLFSDNPTKEQRGASSSSNLRKRKHSIYQDPTKLVQVRLKLLCKGLVCTNKNGQHQSDSSFCTTTNDIATKA